MRAPLALTAAPLAVLALLGPLVLLGPCAAAAASASTSGSSSSSSSSSASSSSMLATAQLSTELATLASEGDALRLWERATASAADAVVDALRRQDSSHTVELKGADLEELRIWHGQSVSLGLEADGQRYSFMVQSEPEWQRLASVLGTAEGGLLPRDDWDSISRDWLSPVSHGSLLPDFALEGPLDVYLSQPTALQLFLPHASDAGTVRRVLLREGAAVMVRGARSVRLRRGLDLPPITLSDFAAIVTADAAEQQPLGVLHLLEGVHAAAQAHWNSSHPDQSLGLVGLELDLSSRGAALLAAPAAAADGSAGAGTGSPRRLRVRRVAEGAIELLPRDGPGTPSGGAAAAGAVALREDDAEGPALRGPWPLKSVHPAQLQSYEKLLRQVITSRLFRPAAPPRRGRSSSSGSSAGAGGGPAAAQGLRVASDIHLRLVDTEAEATTLLQMQLELERRPKLSDAAGSKDGSSSGSSGREGSVEEAGQGAGSVPRGGGHSGSAAAAYLASLDEPPDTLQILAKAGASLGPHEVWTATVQIKGDAQQGTLKFVPLHLQRLDASSDTVQFAPGAFSALLGLGNSTDLGASEMLLA